MKKLIIIVSVSLLSFKTFSQCNITVSNHITSDPDVTYYMAQPEVIYSNQSVDGIIQVNAYIFKLYSANGVKTILNIQVYKKGSREMISPKTLSFSYGGLNKLHTLKPFNVEDIETTSDGFLSQTSIFSIESEEANLLLMGIGFMQIKDDSSGHSIQCDNMNENSLSNQLKCIYQKRKETK